MLSWFSSCLPGNLFCFFCCFSHHPDLLTRGCKLNAWTFFLCSFPECSFPSFMVLNNLHTDNSHISIPSSDFSCEPTPRVRHSTAYLHHSSTWCLTGFSNETRLQPSSPSAARSTPAADILIPSKSSFWKFRSWRLGLSLTLLFLSHPRLDPWVNPAGSILTEHPASHFFCHYHRSGHHQLLPR